MAARVLTLVVLVLGLVLMHHAVIAAPATHAPSIEHERTASSGHFHALAPGTHHGDPHGAMLHLCLAVLAALGVLLLVTLHARNPLAPDDDRDDDASARPVPAPARPPPVPLRLARLQVLRL